MKRQKFLIRKRHRNFGEISGEKEKKTGDVLRDLKTSRGTLDTKRKKI